MAPGSLILPANSGVSSEPGKFEQQDLQGEPGVGIACECSLHVFDLFNHFLSRLKSNLGSNLPDFSYPVEVR